MQQITVNQYMLFL